MTGALLAAQTAEAADQPATDKTNQFHGVASLQDKRCAGVAGDNGIVDHRRDGLLVQSQLPEEHEQRGFLRHRPCLAVHHNFYRHIACVLLSMLFLNSHFLEEA